MGEVAFLDSVNVSQCIGLLEALPVVACSVLSSGCVMLAARQSTSLSFAFRTKWIERGAQK